VNSKEVENFAVEKVENYLRNKGLDVRRPKSNEHGDLIVGDKIIEVKGNSDDWDYKKGDQVRYYIELNSAELIDKFEKNPDKFEIYCVFGIKDKPKCVVVSGKELKEKANRVLKSVKYNTPKEFWKDKKAFNL
jgi:hypothetical protein